MLYKLLMLLGLLDADSAKIDKNDPKRVEVILDKEGHKRLTSELISEAGDTTRETLKFYLESATYDKDSKTSSLIFRFK